MSVPRKPARNSTALMQVAVSAAGCLVPSGIDTQLAPQSTPRVCSVLLSFFQQLAVLAHLARRARSTTVSTQVAPFEMSGEQGSSEHNAIAGPPGTVRCWRPGTPAAPLSPCASPLAPTRADPPGPTQDKRRDQRMRHSNGQGEEQSGEEFKVSPAPTRADPPVHSRRKQHSKQ